MCCACTVDQGTIWGVILSTVNVSRQKTSGDVKAPRLRLPAWWWVGLLLIVAVIAVTFVPGVLESLRHPEAEIHKPGMMDFFPEALIWEGTNFQVNRLVLARFFAAGVLCLILIVVALRVKKVPSRGQAVIEVIAEYVRKNIGIELLGNAKGRQYSTVLATVFFGVLAMNLTGIIPGINIAASSVMSVPLVFAIFAYITFIVAGIRERGWRFFTDQLFLKGVPWPLYILLTPIEFFSTFIVRPATLAIRLLANMIAGHMLLAITYFGTQSMLVAAAAMKPIALLTFAGGIVLTLFELFVAVLQTYVFTMLTAVYIKLSVETH